LAVVPVHQYTRHSAAEYTLLSVQSIGHYLTSTLH